MQVDNREIYGSITMELNWYNDKIRETVDRYIILKRYDETIEKVIKELIDINTKLIDIKHDLQEKK